MRPDKEWWSTQTTRRKALLVLAVIAAVIILAEIGLFTGVWYKSLQGGLSLYLEPSEDLRVLSRGEEALIGFSIGARNAPFCQAICEWQALDLSIGTIIAEGTMLDPGSDATKVEFTMTAPSGRVVIPVQIQAVCRNVETYRCQRGDEQRLAADLVVINVTYSSQELSAADDFTIRAPSWFAATELLSEQLSLIASIDDPRTAVLNETGEAIARLQRLRQDMIGALDDDAPEAASSLLNVELPRGPVDDYEILRSLERDASMRAEQINNHSSELRAAYIIIPDITAQELFVVAEAASDATRRSRELSPANVSMSLQRLQIVADKAVSQAETIIEERSGAVREALSEEILAACTIKEGPCIAEETPQGLVLAVERLSDDCSGLRNIEATIAAYHSVYAKTLMPNATVAETEQAHNVSGIRAQPGWPDREEQLISAARQGRLRTSDPAERLAVSIPIDEGINETIDERCALRNGTLPIPTAMNATLPETPASIGTVTTYNLPEQGCCGAEICGACGSEQRYPVVFVHGHAFAEEATPESSLQAFVPLALELQADGYLYAGHIFTGREEEAPLSALPGGITATTTYYYDSYAEEGDRVFITRKSENIETYAIRLSESIEAVKEETGQDKVLIIAHSMGGLVARSYIDVFGSESVAGLMMIGTPNQGLSGRAERVCPLIGGNRECADMKQGSVFMRKLNTGRPPKVPSATIAGTGCDDGDGVITAGTVAVDWANNHVIEGTCEGNANLLHGKLIEPSQSPDSYSLIKSFIDEHTRIR